MRALVADDSHLIRRIIEGTLVKHLEFEEVVQAKDGSEALKAAGDKEFDVILLDWNMPHMLGIDALRGIRALGIDAPVIMVTSEKEKARIIEAMESGADNYIVKPFEPEKLAEKIEATLYKARNGVSFKQAVRVLVADDSKVARRVLDGILKDRCGVTEVVDCVDGAEAVEMAKGGNFRLICLDWNMPNMLGIEALRTIRASGDTTPVVMVTSEKEKARLIEAFDAGANNYIVKPYEPTGVTHKLRHLLETS